MPGKVTQNNFFVKVEKRKPDIIMAILCLGLCCLLINLLNAVIVIVYNDMHFTIHIDQIIYKIAWFLLSQLQLDLGLQCEVLLCFFFPH